MKEIRIPSRKFDKGCQFRTMAVYRSDTNIVVAIDPGCNDKLGLNPQIYLQTPRGNLRMTEISVPSEKDKNWPYHESARLTPGKPFFMRFKTNIVHTDEEASASGINRDLCISTDCLNDWEGQRLAKAYSVNVAATQAAQIARGSGSLQHRLLELQPTSINNQKIEGGVLNPVDMYFYGLSTLAKTQPVVKEKFLQYLSSTIAYESKGVANNPFDKQDYANNLAKEREEFAKRMFSQPASSPPKSVVIFGYASLDNYDTNSGIMKFRSCRDYGSMVHGMLCSDSGMLISGQKIINERALQIAQEGSLVSQGRAEPIQFSAYRPRGPIYSLYSFGVPQSYSAKIPNNIARSLFEMAKGSPLPKYAADQGFKDKMIGLKILIEEFAPTKLDNGTITYQSIPKSFCFFDYSGSRAVYCKDF